MSLTDDESGTLDPMGLQASSVATLVYGRNWGSRPNAVTWNSPAWGGFSVRAQAGHDGEPGNFNGGRQLSAAIKYAQGSVAVTGLYEELRDARGRWMTCTPVRASTRWVAAMRCATCACLPATT